MRADLAFALTRFDGCDAFEDDVRAVATELMGPYGLEGGERFSAVGLAVEDDQSVTAEARPSNEAAAAPTTTTAPLAYTGGDDAGLTGDGEWSGTNVQEQGVDEPDIVKTDGDLVLTLVDGELRTVRIVDGQPQLVGSLSLPVQGGEQLLADGDTALVLTGGGQFGIASSRAGMALEDSTYAYRPGVSLRTVDLSDPANPTLTGEVSLEGSMVDARMVDGVVRVVTTTGAPDLPLVMPAGSGTRAMEAAERLNRDALADLAAEDWLPRFEAADGDGDVVEEGPLVDCASVYTPVEASGVGMVNVVSVDLRSGSLAPSDAVSVMGTGHTVYASQSGLYVASSVWDEDASNGATEIHRFDTSSRGPVAYVASGRVDGTLINQFALSEHEGDLRVATTRQGGTTGDVVLPVEPDLGTGDSTESGAAVPGGGAVGGDPTQPTFPPDPSPTPTPTATTPADQPETTTTVEEPETTTTIAVLPEPDPFPGPTVVPDPVGASDSMVTVLRDNGGELQAVGSVAGLGIGEQIQSVRFLGDLAFVVTFRQIDPLYTIDLSDPTNPRVVGELKIPGFSSYLHPIADGLLLGIGRDADLSGRTTGMQITLFDVSDLANPTEIQRVSLPDASSDAEWDHHAFLWWPETSTAVVPVQEFGPTGVFTGAIGYRVERAGIGELGRVTHPEDPAYLQGACPEGVECVAPPVELSFGGTPIQRSLVVEGQLVTVSSAGLKTSTLGSLADVGWLAF